AFTRNWDGNPEGAFTDIDFATMTDAQKTAMGTAIQGCQDLETKVRANDGMGGYNCNEQQQKGDMNNMAQNGPPPQGMFGGNCNMTATTCVPQGRGTYFFNPKDPDNNEYCLVSQGGCGSFTVTGTPPKATGLSLDDPDGSRVTEIEFAQSDANAPATGARIHLTVGGVSCTADCTLQQATFDRPPEFDPTSTGDSAHGGPPEACVTAFGNPPPPPASPDDWMNRCKGLCGSKPDACPPPSE
ncbi:MAG: hypothetical protein Q7S00_07940, partial [bacterium]|nr:hypothetical protein [bacterium]